MLFKRKAKKKTVMKEDEDENAILIKNYFTYLFYNKQKRKLYNIHFHRKEQLFYSHSL